MIKGNNNNNESVEPISVDTGTKIAKTQNFNNNEIVESSNALSKGIKQSEDEHASNLVAVYVTRFDTKKGNIIEWQYPEDFDLKGIEFQSLPSGLHSVSQDVIYFTRPPFVGLSLFRNESTLDQSVDRGAHMAAVGILVSPTTETGLCGRPWNHLMFLQNEILKHVNFSDDYSNLIEYFKKNRIVLDSTDNDSSFEPDSGPSTSYRLNKPQYSRNRCLSTSELSTISYLAPVLPMHPAHHFPNFVRSCGPTIFLLWKAALLKKRILFYSPPPVEEVCYFVYGTCLISNVSSSVSRTLKYKVDKMKPLFNVGVCDIPTMEATEGGFVACTTDLIFQYKKNLYDLLVILPHKENQYQQPELIASPGSQLSTKINATDIRRYRVLLKLLASYGVSNCNEEEDDGGDITDTLRKMMFGDESSDEILNESSNAEGSRENSEIEVEMIRFFHGLTTNLFNTLQPMVLPLGFNDVEETAILNLDHLSRLGLDPHEDGAFVEKFAEIYFGRKIEVKIVVVAFGFNFNG
ncbi:14435_t:CDS:10 [Funneliformis mosseae]|uniref:14435_t:CDS:1 n=1 Tax=Funneliformis mosseae TaxID=27381 RepID=A0A9N8V6L2_FUNMO|nr:14435_t:CDS:10 [Funneliformis mosseae]